MNFESTELSSNLRLVRLQGRMDTMGTSEIEPKLAACCGDDNYHVLVDLGGVDFLTSFGIRLLMQNAKVLTDHGGHMYLISPVSNVKDTLDVSGVSSVIPVYESIELAKAALAGD